MINPNEQFEIYQNIILKEIVKEFGQEYQMYIKDYFSHLKIIFEVSPKEEYLNLKDSHEKYHIFDKISKYNEYIKDEQLKKQIFAKYINNNFDEWISCFVDLQRNKNYNKIINLFSSNYNHEILIDYFSSNWNLKLTNGSLTNSQIAYINSKKNKFISIINKNGYRVKNIDMKIVDAFIKCRDYFTKRLIIEQMILKNNNYISRLAKIINETNFEIINDILKKNNPTCFKYVKNNGQINSFIYFPISRLKHYNIKTIDIILIHEIIHYIQKYTDEELILNEALVQYKAIKIAKRLHKHGIYIFDNINNVKENGECLYEELFPFIEIIHQYIPDELINKAILEDNYCQFSKLLGDSLNEYFNILQQLYNALYYNLPISDELEEKYNNCLIEINKYYMNNNNDTKKLILKK